MERHWRHVEETAYKVLLDHSDGAFPVSPLKIAHSMGIQVIDRRDAGDLFSLFSESELMVDSPAVSLSHSSGWRGIILDGRHRNPLWLRLMLAHEIAHFALGHFEPANQKILLEERRSASLLRGSFSRSWIELSCDIFAVWVLSPKAVLKHYGVLDFREISRLCRIPPLAAQIISMALKIKAAPLSQNAALLCDRFSYLADRSPDLFLRPRPDFSTDISTEFI